jgi:hypothetical protein
MAQHETSTEFNSVAGKFVNPRELTQELKNVFQQESGKFGAKVRAIFSMNPDKIVEAVEWGISMSAVIGNDPDIKKLAYFDGSVAPVKTYLDAVEICTRVSKTNFSDADKQAVFKAVQSVPDHSAVVTAALARKYKR